MLKLSPTLDRVGVFGRSVADVALLAQAMMGFDDRDTAMSLRARADLTGLVGSEPPVKLHFACVKTTAWDKAEPATLEAFGELVDHLGDRAAMIELSDALERVEGWFRTVQLAELAHSIAPAYEAGRDKLSEGLCKLIDEGQSISAHDYLHAVDRMTATGSVIDDVLADYDAILTPAALGEAPKGLASAGDPVLSEIWSYCGLPAISLPILQGPAGLPLGVQMIAGRFDDARLLRNASWLLQSVEE